MNYKIDEERIFSLEFIGMIKRNHISGAMLFEIGDSTMGDGSITLSETMDVNGVPDNLQSMVLQSGGSIWISPSAVEAETISGDASLRAVQLKAYTEFNGTVYDITSDVVFSLSSTSGVSAFGTPVVIGGIPVGAPDYSSDGAHASNWAAVNVDGTQGKVRLSAWSVLSGTNPAMLKGSPDAYNATSPGSWRLVVPGDKVWVEVDATWGGLTAQASVIADIVA
jgi:hypothetical protein